jgi:hypothetical protein
MPTKTPIQKATIDVLKNIAHATKTRAGKVMAGNNNSRNIKGSISKNSNDIKIIIHIPPVRH